MKKSNKPFLILIHHLLLLLPFSICYAENKPVLTIVSMIENDLQLVKIKGDVDSFMGKMLGSAVSGGVFGVEPNYNSVEFSGKKSLNKTSIGKNIDQFITNKLSDYYKSKNNYLITNYPTAANLAATLIEKSANYKSRNPCKNKNYRVAISDLIRQSGSDKIIFIIPELNTFSFKLAPKLRLSGPGLIYNYTFGGDVYSFISVGICAYDLKSNNYSDTFFSAEQIKITNSRKLTKEEKTKLANFLLKQYKDAGLDSPTNVPEYKNIFSDADFYSGKHESITNIYQSDLEENSDDWEKLAKLVNPMHHSYGELENLPEPVKQDVYRHIIKVSADKILLDIPAVNLDEIGAVEEDF